VHTDYQALPRVNTRLRGIAGWGLNKVTEVTLKFWILLQDDAHAVAGYCMVLHDYNQKRVWMRWDDFPCPAWYSQFASLVFLTLATKFSLEFWS
jgi:hypothetical protein